MLSSKIFPPKVFSTPQNAFFNKSTYAKYVEINQLNKQKKEPKHGSGTTGLSFSLNVEQNYQPSEHVELKNKQNDIFNILTANNISNVIQQHIIDYCIKLNQIHENEHLTKTIKYFAQINNIETETIVPPPIEHHDELENIIHNESHHIHSAHNEVLEMKTQNLLNNIYFTKKYITFCKKQEVLTSQMCENLEFAKHNLENFLWSLNEIKQLIIIDNNSNNEIEDLSHMHMEQKCEEHFHKHTNFNNIIMNDNDSDSLEHIYVQYSEKNICDDLYTTTINEINTNINNAETIDLKNDIENINTERNLITNKDINLSLFQEI